MTAAMRALAALYAIGPILFGVGFMAPVLAALLPLAGLSEPFGLPPIVTGLAVGFAWGCYAKIKGSWI